MDVSIQALRELLVEAGIESCLAREIDPAAPLLKQGIDSIDFPAFSLAVESRFSVVIDERSSLSLRSLDDFSSYLKAKLG